MAAVQAGQVRGQEGLQIELVTIATKVEPKVGEGSSHDLGTGDVQADDLD